MKGLFIPESYEAKLSLLETERAIKKIKDFFQIALALRLNLERVSAPLFVRPETGLNDDLNGVERAVSFDVPGIGGSEVQIIHSLAKWKRMALKKYDFKVGTGLYTDMNAIRRDEDLDNIHSIYVDQWDWEKIIKKEDRDKKNLKKIVKEIYQAMKATEEFIEKEYPVLMAQLPEKIFFITSQELEDMYPGMTGKERENAITKEHGAVFVMEIGKVLSSGEKHDGRAPDYDDWELNGDILVWNKVLDSAFEISSMGIRVDEDSLVKQLKIAGCEERSNMKFHKDVIECELPYTVGGGIGQSRLCMMFLQKAHIGEVQSAIWPKEMIDECVDAGIKLL